MTDSTQDIPKDKKRRRRRRKRSNLSSYIAAVIMLLIIAALGCWWITVNEFSSINDVFDWFRGASEEVRESELSEHLENSVVTGEG